MPDNIEVPFINLQGHALECYRFLRDLDYLLVTQIQSPGKYFLLPPPGNLSSDPPAEIKFKRQDASYNRPTSLKNPIDAKNLAANLDNALRDELDLKQYDQRWQSYIYGPSQHAAGYSSMKEGGCGSITMEVVMDFLQRKYGVTPALADVPAGKDGQKDAQWAEVKDVTDWLGQDADHGRVAGGGTQQGLIKKEYFEAKWPGFTLDKIDSRDIALSHLRTDELIIFNGIVNAFATYPTLKTSKPDLVYNGHVVVLWCLETSPANFDVVRIFDPGGGGRYMIADNIGKEGGEFWYPHPIDPILGFRK